jgi:hypothetical protein
LWIGCNTLLIANPAVLTFGIFGIAFHLSLAADVACH